MSTAPDKQSENGEEEEFKGDRPPQTRPIPAASSLVQPQSQQTRDISPETLPHEPFDREAYFRHKFYILRETLILSQVVFKKVLTKKDELIN